MFRRSRPTPAEIEIVLRTIEPTEAVRREFLDFASGLRVLCVPPGFVQDRSQSTLGNGRPIFEAAVSALRQWQLFDLGWVRVANPAARIKRGQIVAVQVHSLGLWSLNLSRIVEVIDVRDSFGFIYKTTSLHVEEGEERFLLAFDSRSGDVTYHLEAVSRPRALLARIGFPVTRTFQHRFARDSHRRMAELVSTRLGMNPE